MRSKLPICVLELIANYTLCNRRGAVPGAVHGSASNCRCPLAAGLESTGWPKWNVRREYKNVSRDINLVEAKMNQEE